MDKVRLVQIIQGYQKLYKEIEFANKFRTELFPFGDDITHLDIKDVADKIRYGVFEDVTYWSVVINGSHQYAGEINNDWLNNLRTSSDIEQLYYDCLSKDYNYLALKMNMVKDILSNRQCKAIKI